jgi:hypothetical protein
MTHKLFFITNKTHSQIQTSCTKIFKFNFQTSAIVHVSHKIPVFPVSFLPASLYGNLLGHICVYSSAAQLWNSYCQEKTKQDKKTCKLRDNRGNVHYSYGCYGGDTHLPSSTRLSGSGWGKISCTSTLQSAILALPSPQLGAQQNTDEASGVGPHVQYGGQSYEASILFWTHI